MILYYTVVMKSANKKALIARINRKDWWHVPPSDPRAYYKRGKFYASTYREAEFYGRPVDAPQRVSIEKPLVGDERTVAKVLRIPQQYCGMTLGQIAAHDARWRNAALKKGYDAIAILSPSGFKLYGSGKLPRSIELNVLKPFVA